MPVPVKDSEVITISSSSVESDACRPEKIPKKKPPTTASKGKIAGTPNSNPRKRGGVGQTRVDFLKEEVEASSCSSAPLSGHGGGGGGGHVGTVSSVYKFPVARVRRLMDGNERTSRNGSVVRPSHEAVFLANKASELFLELFAQDANFCARRERKKSISYRHLSSNVRTKKRYEFLSDFVPEKLKAEDALKARTSIDQ